MTPRGGIYGDLHGDGQPVHTARRQTTPMEDAKAAFENIHSVIGERGLLNQTAKIQQLCRDGLDALAKVGR